MGAESAEPSRILIVDDEPDILSSVRLLLEQRLPGVSVQTALSGEEGLQELRRRRTHLILVDFRMPGMDGLEFLRRAAELEPSVPRILMTAFPDLEVAVRAINEAEVTRFLVKPFDTEQLLQGVRLALLDRRTHDLWQDIAAPAPPPRAPREGG